MKKFATLVFTLLVLGTQAQKVFGPTPKNMKSDRAFSALAEGAFFFEGFENAQIGSLPFGWSTSSNASVGFTTGSAGDSPSQTNENGYWPVPNHGVFAMTNDDVCNCDKSADYLTSKVIPLGGLKHIKIGFESFIASSANEQATLEFTADGFNWVNFQNIPISNHWSRVEWSVPDSFLTNQFQFRFHYSDQGNYASGFAVDNIYLRQSEKSNPEIKAVYAFEQNDIYSQSLYEAVPLSIARDWEFDFGVEINSEKSQVRNVVTEFFATDATDDTSAIQSLKPYAQEVYSTNISCDLYASEIKTYNMFYRLLEASNDTVLTPIVLKTFTVSDSLYTRTTYVNDGFGISLQGSVHEIGTTFHLQEDLIKTVSIKLHSTTQTNSKAVVHFHNLISGITEFSSDTISITSNQINNDLELAVNQNFTPGVYLVTLEKISGSISLATTSSKDANHREVLAKDSSGWMPFSYFPFITLTIPRGNCKGDIMSVVEQISCAGNNDASIEIKSAELSGEETYNWNTGATSTTIENLGAGTYAVSVTDTNGCVYLDSVEIENPGNINFNAAISPEQCHQQNGSIDLNVSGGTEPFQFWIDSVQCNEVITGLSAGNYFIETIDANGCYMSQLVSVSGSDSLLVDYTSISPNCDSNNGAINLITNGTGPFTYQWNNGETSASLDSISSGIYSVIVTDSSGCEIETEIALNDDLAALISESNHTDVSCFGNATGAIDLTLFGGTSPFNFNWNDGETTEDRLNLEAGIYEVSVSDASNCKSFFKTEIFNQSTPILFDFDANGIYCAEDLGEARILAIDNALSFTWSTGTSSWQVDSLHSGVYTVTAQDSFGCLSTDSVLIDSIPALSATIDSLFFDQDSAGYYGATIYIEVGGGSPNYSYEWNTGDYSKNLTTSDTGLFTLIVTDQFTCETSISKYLSGDPQSIDKPIIEQELLVFPNPNTDGIIQIKSSKRIYQSTIYNTNGQIVIESTPSNTSSLHTVDISELSTGIYLIRTTHMDGGVVFSSLVRLNN